jgi:hypothetical protein
MSEILVTKSPCSCLSSWNVRRTSSPMLSPAVHEQQHKPDDRIPTNGTSNWLGSDSSQFDFSTRDSPTHGGKWGAVVNDCYRPLPGAWREEERRADERRGGLRGSARPRVVVSSARWGRSTGGWEAPWPWQLQACSGQRQPENELGTWGRPLRATIQKSASRHTAAEIPSSSAVPQRHSL